jgi:hypothetical protein
VAIATEAPDLTQAQYLMLLVEHKLEVQGY